MRILLWLACALMPSLVAAQDIVPERRVAITSGVDFYGADLRSIFETTPEICQRACLADSACRAYTYNTRSNSCFLKAGVTDETPYEGALSARIYDTDLAVLREAAGREAQLEFLNEADFDAARDLAERLSVLHYTGNNPLDVMLRGAANSRSVGNFLDAMRWTGSAITVSDRADLWAEYAELARIVPHSSSSTRRTLRARAIPAAINGYLRATSEAQQVFALMTLADTLETANRGRDMIPTLRLAYEVQPRADVEAALNRAIGLYGFRVVNTTVDSDAAAPRICAVFNEELVRAGVDYAPFVQLPDRTLSVDHDGNQICIDGVEHGTRYRLVFRAGLPAQSGEALVRDVEQVLYVRDRAPSLAFSGRSYVLPKLGTAALPIETVNIAEVDLVLRQVSDRGMVRVMEDNLFGRPLNYWQDLRLAEEYASEVWRGTGSVAMELNRNMTTRLPLAEAIAGLPAGIYVLQASAPGEDEDNVRPATQWFVLSDLGLATMSGSDGLHVFVRGLGDGVAKAGIEVELLSRANAILGTAETNAEGYAQFAPGLMLGQGAASPAMIVARMGEDDLTFLSLNDPAFDLSDRGVEGRAPAPPIDVFMATDRGAYRAGEVVHVTALLRDERAEALAGLPATAILFRPDGVEYSRHVSTDGSAGGHVFALPIAATAPRGTWRIEMRVDVDAPALASETVLVEDFLPERIDFELSLPERIALGDAPALTIEARYLFGPPAGDLPIEGEVTLSAANGLPDWPGYRFGRYDERFSRVSQVLPGDRRTGVDGRAVLSVSLPETEQVDRPLELEVIARLSEGSGRPVERSETVTILPQNAMIGIKPKFDWVVGEGSDAEFDVIGIGTDLQPEPMEIRWEVNRLTTRYQWYRLYGNWNWEPTTTRERVASGEATLGETPLQISAPVEWGKYEIKIERTDGTFVAASDDFYAGWYAPADTSVTPDVLEVGLDRENYASGDTAMLRIVPRYAGTALITVMSNRIIAMETVEVVEGENVIPLSVTDEWGAGAYVSATVIRPMDVEAGRNPARALGLSYAQVDPGDHALSVAIEAPAEVRPRQPLEVALRIEGLNAGDSGFVTLAAVDLGILNLTGFETPDPQGHYFGQRRLGMELRDIYGRLIDGLNGAMGVTRSGGDASRGMQMQSPPPTEDLVTFFSGPVEVDADGLARVSFDVPSFNGTLRLMVIGWSSRGVGAASQDVLIRDNVVMSASLPRFLAPGDQSQLRLDIVHTDGPTGAFDLSVVSSDPNDLFVHAGPGSVLIEEGQKTSLTLPISARSVGQYEIDLALTSVDGSTFTQTLRMGVLANDPEITRTSRFTLSAGETFTFDRDVFAGFMPGSGSSTLSAGPLARFDAPGLLNALDRYPYGCTEQITSRAMPLLYFDAVAEAMGQTDRNVTERIEQSIEAILARQASNGSFGLWYPTSGDMWLDAYVGDFLSRARAQGYSVPDRAFTLAMDRLRNQVNFAPELESGGQDLAYALMVLAREGSASMADLRYFADEKAEAFNTPLGAAQLGAALAFYGDQLRADRMFARAGRMMTTRMRDERSQLWRIDYGSNLRDAAAVLTLAVEAGSTAIDRDTLARRVALGERLRSTQEATWTLLAANALISDLSAGGINVDGVALTGPLVRVLEAETESVPILIENTGDSDTNITLTTFGVPEVAVPSGGTGYAIEREYYTLEGEPISPNLVQVGDRLVTVIRVSPFARIEARLMVNDPLPAGFEIDNPNLLRAGDLRQLEWLDPVATQQVEFRSDRFLAAVDWRSDRPFHLAYIVRAVSAGEFHQPAASVEDMYRPQYRARTDAGRIVISE